MAHTRVVAFQPLTANLSSKNFPVKHPFAMTDLPYLLPAPPDASRPYKWTCPFPAMKGKEI